MFGIGGGELMFIMFIALMLFGSDKIPDIARTLGKGMAQLKNATNDIKSEIQKGAEANGFDSKTLTDITGSINAQINQAKENLLGDTPAQLHTFKESIVNDTTAGIAQTKEEIDDITGPIKRQM
ncbi:Sec-independent protein translocase [Flavobacterium noncentrifugens]|uniref:Sec-independent protein translocase protein TatA n=1 Tax=Flavobacterium noncentrifugens TaxID=1128970 RepID=A0A1G8RPX2_9FLAO|nr:twin-arginine translocase TatA/TatE family subunit [Flavobacterium noncentrifugens]GEP49513.1 Sec-independent protein translocase [Flavobacterium noncentrifugens]SDJ18555.1 sec-independent protein translocase protein TatA [Flavobacterium noncentrifugens]